MQSTYPSSWPQATAQRSNAAAPKARNWRHPPWTGGQPDKPTTASPTDEQPDGRIGTPSRRAPPPRTASNRVPVAWFTTTAANASPPDRSTAHSEVANQGSPRAALVDP